MPFRHPLAMSLIVLPGLVLQGCVTLPPQSYVLTVVQQKLDKNAICVLWPGKTTLRGDSFYVFEDERRLLEPFVVAGLLRTIPTPAEATGLRRNAVWFERTNLGNDLNVPCLVDSSSYPRRYQPGFRIGRRDATELLRLVKLRSDRCRSYATASVRYRLVITANWFDPKQFKTNFSAFSVNPDTLLGNIDIGLASSDRRQWSEQDILDVHSNFVCLRGS